MTQSHLEKWQKEARQRLVPYLKDSPLPREYTEEIDTLISQIIADTESVERDRIKKKLRQHVYTDYTTEGMKKPEVLRWSIVLQYLTPPPQETPNTHLLAKDKEV